MINITWQLLSKIFLLLIKANNKAKEADYRKRYVIHSTARLNYLDNIWLKGNIEIGANTYINSGRFVTGPNSKIVIGNWCAIGHNVNMIGQTHDILISTGPIDCRPLIEKDILVGDRVWIGSNVFIREGVTIGNDSIIGANSVVTKNVPEKAIVGGVPAKILKYKEA